MSVPSDPVSDDFGRKRPSRSWKRYRTPLVVGGAAVLLAAGLLLKHHLAGYESTDDAQVDAHLYAISARVPGYVVAVHVNDNQYVRQGEVLVELDPIDYQLAVAQARAELANSEATAASLSVAVPISSATTSSQLASSVADVQSADANILAAKEQAAAAHAQLEEAEANDARMQEDLRRYQPLAEKQEISTQMYAQAAEADVQQKRAALEQAERNLGYTRILAPADGQVRKNVVVGMNVQTGQQLLTIVPVDDVWITGNFKETQLRHLRPGQRVEVAVDSNGRTYKGQVDSLAAAAGPIFSLLPPENATGNYVKVVQRVPVKIVLEPGENRDRQLLPGMSVVPTVYLR